MAHTHLIGSGGPLQPADADDLPGAGLRQEVRHLRAMTARPPEPGTLQLPLEIFSDRAKTQFIASWLHELYPRLNHDQIDTVALKRDPHRRGYVVRIVRVDGAWLELFLTDTRTFPEGEAAKLVLFLQ